MSDNQISNHTLSQEGYSALPCSGKMLYQIGHFREKYNHSSITWIPTRIFAEAAYGFVAIASMIEFVARGTWTLYSSLRYGICYDEWAHFVFFPIICKQAFFEFFFNLFTTKFSSILQNEHFLFKRTVDSDRAKILSHWLEIRGKVKLNEKEIELEGGMRGQFYSSIKASLAAFKNSGYCNLTGSKLNESFEVIEEALDFTMQSPSRADLLKRIQSEKLCFIDGGWEKHSVALAFYKGYLIIGNGGERGSFLFNFWRNISDVEIVKIAPKKVSMSVITKILNLRCENQEKGIQFLYETLPSLLSENGTIGKDELCSQLRFLTLGQSIGNCALHSILAVLSPVIALSGKGQPSVRKVRQSKTAFMLFKNWAAVQFGNLYKDEKFLANSKLGNRVVEMRDLKALEFATIRNIAKSAIFSHFPVFSKYILTSDSILGEIVCVFGLGLIMSVSPLLAKESPLKSAIISCCLTSMIAGAAATSLKEIFEVRTLSRIFALGGSKELEATPLLGKVKIV